VKASDFSGPLMVGIAALAAVILLPQVVNALKYPAAGGTSPSPSPYLPEVPNFCTPAQMAAGECTYVSITPWCKLFGIGCPQPAGSGSPDPFVPTFPGPDQGVTGTVPLTGDCYPQLLGSPPGNYIQSNEGWWCMIA
jgi:hypothetical protein